MGRRTTDISLVKRDDIFYIRYPNYTGYGLSTGTSDPILASQKLADFIANDMQKVEKSQEEQPLTVSEALDIYMQEYAEVGHVTSLDHPIIMEKWLKAHFGGMLVRNIEQTDVTAYIKKRRAGEIGQVSGDGTINRELRYLLTALNFCAKKKRGRRLRAEEMPYITLPKPPAPRDRWLTKVEARDLLVAARYAPSHEQGTGKFQYVPTDNLTRAHTFCMIALHTGSRSTAIEELEWPRVLFDDDKESGIIKFNPEGRAQTSKMRPIVPIHRDLYWYLRGLKQQADNQWVLGSPAGIYATFRTACDRAGFTDVTPHTLRHTFATWLAQAGVSLWSIAGLLGDNVETVFKRYAHHSPDHLRVEVNKIDLHDRLKYEEMATPIDEAIMAMKM